MLGLGFEIKDKLTMCYRMCKSLHFTLPDCAKPFIISQNFMF